jgi:hypothetical protein
MEQPQTLPPPPPHYYRKEGEPTYALPPSSTAPFAQVTAVQPLPGQDPLVPLVEATPIASAPTEEELRMMAINNENITTDVERRNLETELHDWSNQILERRGGGM